MQRRVEDLFASVEATPEYQALEAELATAYRQAARGKGLERHASGEPFEEQLICVLERMGLTFCEGQAVKKIVEGHRLGGERGIFERHGAMVYLAARNVVEREQSNTNTNTGGTDGSR